MLVCSAPGTSTSDGLFVLDLRVLILDGSAWLRASLRLALLRNTLEVVLDAQELACALASMGRHLGRRHPGARASLTGPAGNAGGARLAERLGQVEGVPTSMASRTPHLACGIGLEVSRGAWRLWLGAEPVSGGWACCSSHRTGTCSDSRGCS